MAHFSAGGDRDAGRGPIATDHWQTMSNNTIPNRRKKLFQGDRARKTNDTSRERGHSREHLSLLGLAKSTKEKTPLSGIFLVLGLAIFLLSTASMILMLGAQAGGANLAWGLVFLPLWIGDGLTVVCLIGAMICRSSLGSMLWPECVHA